MISAFPRVADHVPLKTVHLELLHVPMSLTVQDSILFREAAEGRSLDARPATGVIDHTHACCVLHVQDSQFYSSHRIPVRSVGRCLT